MAGVSGISAVAPPLVKGNVAYLAGTLSVALDSQAAMDAVAWVREAIHPIPSAQPLPAQSPQPEEAR
jgi:hypothetical protein